MSAISITAANVLSSGASNGAVIIPVTLAAGVTVTQGQTAYKLALGTYGLCDNDVSLIAATFAGFYLSAGSPGQVVSLCVSDPNYTPGGTLSKGAACYTMATAGAFTQTVADNTTNAIPSAIGIATSTTTMTFSAPGFLCPTAL